MDKKAIITAVVILIAAAAITLWSLPKKPPPGIPDRIIEPPREEQIDAQVKGLISGSIPPRPIPLYVDGVKFDAPDSRELPKLLIQLNYRSVQVKKGSPPSQYFVNSEYKELVWYADGPEHTDAAFIAVIDPQSEFNSGLAPPGNIKLHNKNGIYLGPFHLGITYEEAIKLLNSTKCKLPEYKPDLTAHNLLATSEIRFERGIYSYTIWFYRNRLVAISLSNIGMRVFSRKPMLSKDKLRQVIEEEMD